MLNRRVSKKLILQFGVLFLFNLYSSASSLAALPYEQAYAACLAVSSEMCAVS